jgi:hypothetical protein
MRLFYVKAVERRPAHLLATMRPPFAGERNGSTAQTHFDGGSALEESDPCMICRLPPDFAREHAEAVDLQNHGRIDRQMLYTTYLGAFSTNVEYFTF